MYTDVLIKIGSVRVPLETRTPSPKGDAFYFEAAMSGHSTIFRQCEVLTNPTFAKLPPPQVDFSESIEGHNPNDSVLRVCPELAVEGSVHDRVGTWKLKDLQGLWIGDNMRGFLESYMETIGAPLELADLVLSGDPPTAHCDAEPHGFELVNISSDPDAALVGVVVSADLKFTDVWCAVPTALLEPATIAREFRSCNKSTFGVLDRLKYVEVYLNMHDSLSNKGLIEPLSVTLAKKEENLDFLIDGANYWEKPPMAAVLTALRERVEDASEHSMWPLARPKYFGVDVSAVPTVLELQALLKAMPLLPRPEQTIDEATKTKAVTDLISRFEIEDNTILYNHAVIKLLPAILSNAEQSLRAYLKAYTTNRRIRVTWVDCRCVIERVYYSFLEQVGSPSMACAAGLAAAARAIVPGRELTAANVNTKRLHAAFKGHVLEKGRVLDGQLIKNKKCSPWSSATRTTAELVRFSNILERHHQIPTEGDAVTLLYSLSTEGTTAKSAMQTGFRITKAYKPVGLDIRNEHQKLFDSRLRDLLKISGPERAKPSGDSWVAAPFVAGRLR
jgi:hypothetical protein